MDEAEIKVAFVSNLNGTTLTEVSLGCFLAPLCFISRGLFILMFHLNKGVLPLSSSAHLLLDFALLITPLVLSCTILSDILHWVIIVITVADVCAISLLYSNKNKRPASYRSLIDSFEHSHVESKVVPFVTAFRVLVNVKTAISILAVDFSVFPRRYAKTETYGTGVMDFGVGAYVMANAMVCPEARGKKVQGSKLSHLAKQLFSVWPLVVLGFVRLASVKSSGYHEHVTEYGLHWNFFFTLAIVRVVASAILAMFPINISWLLSLLISGAYQVVLETTDLKRFLTQNAERSSFVQANKEGIFSVVGYVAVYMAGVQVGVYLMQTRTLVKDWIRVLWKLLLGSFGLWVALHACQTHIEPVSRRMANLPFCLWTIAQSLFFLSCLGLADIALLFAKVVSNFSAVSASWNPRRHSETEQKIRSKLDALCLIQSVSRNQLLFFLLANVMTGLTNILVDTLKSNDFFAVCVLLSYMFINSLIIFILHVNNITIKFW
ncbi:phosphatidylinositol-glycan biosynthesis class W protein [Neoarius graeffei]|uniref:phosphatidylinositol-glycan biosynthesis class W protein n=1 Tax=Neoarius graeffei TaxID=443677 RepID=UPI00298BF982|nr:phosphatidylinositol-glycan biosynthesis class W protein [Neoarius graeffei]XP_060769289.1 phosphatidylinositol-glycan biosynthesis class W protein [Neoarius graeffei]XP_060769290.1 phosphatidylinositol-glycan biosynthesis class W protein [Neoarius graeffei]